MRNGYGGYCYRCTLWVAPGDGHFERTGGAWRTQHADCAIACRGKPAEFVRQFRAQKIAAAVLHGGGRKERPNV